MIARRFILVLAYFAAVLVSSAAETNYFCVVCGKGPLSGRIWISKWGAVCAVCYRLENRCSLCGLPMRDSDDPAKTGDGRFICKFDRPNTVLDAGEAREVFTAMRRDLVELFGHGIALNFPDVTVNLFDVDYWSEKGREDSLHKFGFSYTRKSRKGSCTHEVVLLSGRFRVELAATAAHEYTHLWVNENRPAEHSIDGDTIEAICELAAYKLMESRAQPEHQQKILNNPYTHGEIKEIVALEKENGMGYIFNWVKNGTTARLASAATARVAPIKPPAIASTNVPPPQAEALKLGGLLLDGQSRQAIINGVLFAAGETKNISLRDRVLSVRCREIRRNEAVLEISGRINFITLKIGDERFVP